MADLPDQQQLIAALLDPRCYPHPAKRIRLIETHISWVLLAGRYAYKIKKAVDLGFLDFSSLAARKHYCEEELRLNRRLAPELYLDVIAISGTPDEPQLSRSGHTFEYAVRMRRFAAAATLDRQLARNTLAPQLLDRLAADLARFHMSLPPAAIDSPYGTAASIRTAALQNFEQLQPLLENDDDRRLLDTVRQASELEYATCEQAFELRRRQGQIRECHGDLHLGNIALVRGQALPFDGIEFAPALRWIDTINDIAFLHMDLLYRAQPAPAFRLLNGWLEHTGDYAGLATLRFYCAYRAMVRAKINALRAQQCTARKKSLELSACRSHLALAQRCLSSHRPALIITHGLPGSGKSTFAQAALEQLQAIRIRSDVERKRLFGLAAHADSRSAVGGGIYRASATARTYARLLELARQLLAAGYPVIVDAAFLQHAERKAFQALAQEMNVPFAIASLQASNATLRNRIAQRQSAASDASEAGIEVLEKLQAVQQTLNAEELRFAVTFSDEAQGELDDATSWHNLKTLLDRTAK